MKIFLGGRVERAEFHEIERDVQGIAFRAQAELVARTRLTVDSVFDRFIGESYEGPEPTLRSLYDVDVFLLCRSFPDEFSAADVAALRRTAPLAPIVIVAGDLCAGEDRTGEYFPGARRFYVGSWREEGRREFERFFDKSGASGILADAPLASLVDQLASGKGANPRPAPRGSGRAIVLADDPDMAAFLKDAFQDAGYEPQIASLARFPNDGASWGEGVARVVVDAVDLSDPSFPSKLRAIKAAAPGTPIDLIAFAPRADERLFYERRDLWGRVRVLSSPFDVEYLVNGTRDGLRRRESAAENAR